MIPPAPLPHEIERLAALRRYAILDTSAEPSFDEIAQLASAVCRTPIALISLVDADRQWFKSAVGLGVSETSREVSFCGHALHQDRLFVVRDARIDARFSDNPLVVSEPRIRFYAGAPLTTPEGMNVGTLCVIDRKERELDEEQRFALAVLARQVIVQLEHRRLVTEQQAEVRSERQALDRMRTEFLVSVNHELRTPLTSIRASLGLLAAGILGELPSEARPMVSLAERNSARLVAVMNHILDAAERDSVHTAQSSRPAPRSPTQRLASATNPEDSQPAIPPQGVVAGREPATVRARENRMKALVVDDEEDVRFVAELSLGRVGGMDVVVAASGEEGLALALSERPDVILLDMMMPGMDGAATFEALRQKPETASIPVVFITAKAISSEVLRLENLGAKAVIVKPFNPMTLAERIRAILEP